MIKKKKIEYLANVTKEHVDQIITLKEKLESSESQTDHLHLREKEYEFKINELQKNN